MPPSARLTTFARPSRLVALAAGVAMAVASIALTAVPARADSPPSLPATVSADALPTWQIDGVVWSQAVVGTTVYVTGSFSKARPPGVPMGGAGEIDAANIFAFDISTGNPVAGFHHSLDAQGLVVRAAPDGKTVYVGGDFTTVDGQARAHVAAFDTATGALLTNFAPRTDGQVRAFAFAGNAVFAGGNFRSSNGSARTELAAWDATTGQLTSWAPTADGSGYVWDMVTSPDRSRLIVAGSFTALNGATAYGMGSLDAGTGATLPWAATNRIQSAGLNGAISSLSTDGTQVYGTGYAFGAGASFEGTFAADPYTGNINWLNDCLGDTYSSFPMNSVLYSVSHHHDCSVVGGFPDTSPRSRWQKAVAEPTFPVGIINRKDAYGWDYTGLPYSGQLQWYPDLDFGSYTSAKQAAWSVTGNANYVVLGGEFPTVNGVAQQGLVRFPSRPVGPHAMGPVYNSAFTPAPYSNEAGTVRVPFSSLWDRDDTAITYDVFRSPSPGTKIATFTRTDGEFWRLPSLSITDTGQAPGASVRYQVRAKDPDGNVQWSAWSPYVTVSGAPVTAYRAAVRQSGASHYWRLGETGGSTLFDDVGNAPGTPTSLSLRAAGALNGDSDTAVTSAGGTTGKMTTKDPATADAALSVEAWVKTTSTRGGRIVGYGDSSTGTSTSGTTDRVLYLDNAGRVNFAINDGSYRTVYSRGPVNDGQWHHVVGALDVGGMQLYVDGTRVGRDQTATTPKNYVGYWRIGADQTSGFANRPTDTSLAGTIDDVAVYPRALTKAEVQGHDTASGRTGSWSTTPADAYGASVAADQPDLYWRLSEASGNSALDASSGGTTGNVTGTVTRGQPGAISGNTATTFDGSSGLVVAQQSWNSPSAYSAELWFKTTSTKGGKLIGFGNASSGLSTTYDRHVTVYSNGKLSFGVNNGAQTAVVSAASYNDGGWHQVVATQGPDGMKLWVDSQLVGSNAATSAQSYLGYWRVGGDRTWGNTTSNFIAGTLDEVAVYPTVLTEQNIHDHYVASGRAAANRPPAAAFTTTNNNLALQVDGSGSTDPDGPVASYAWDFGDGASGSGVTASHAYAASGTYTVRLTATDPGGLTSTITHDVTVAANLAPTAAFTASVTSLKVSLDGTGSSDSDGSIASYGWDFGDGTSGSGAAASHSYAAAGTYTVKLTVIDDDGATATTTRSVTVAEPPNQSPMATFVDAVSGLKVSVDGSASSDPDGTLTSYAWDFGDGATGTGATASHSYPQAGSYTVRLTVTDNQGSSDSVTKQVTVAAPTVFAKDDFTRTVANGWGPADQGGSWAIAPNTTTALGKFSVADGMGKLSLSAGNSYTASLPSSFASNDTELKFNVSMDKAATGGGYYVSAIGRQIDGANDYRAKVRIASTGVATLWLAKTVAGTETLLTTTTVNGLTYNAGDSLTIRLQVSGSNSTTIKAKLWKSGTTEPAGWTATTTDGTSVLQGTGTVGVYGYLSGSATTPVVMAFDGVWAGPSS